MAVPDISLGGFRVCWTGGGILVVYGFCAAAGRVGISGAGVGGNGGVLCFAGPGSVGASDVCGLRLLAYESEFLSGAMWSDPGDFKFCVRLVPVGMGTGRI